MHVQSGNAVRGKRGFFAVLRATSIDSSKGKERPQPPEEPSHDARFSPSFFGSSLPRTPAPTYVHTNITRPQPQPSRRPTPRSTPFKQRHPAPRRRGAIGRRLVEPVRLEAPEPEAPRSCVGRRQCRGARAGAGAGAGFRVAAQKRGEHLLPCQRGRARYLFAFGNGGWCMWASSPVEGRVASTCGRIHMHKHKYTVMML